MTSLVKANFNDTMKAVDDFLAAPHKGQILDKDLKVVDKTNIRPVLLAPFYRFFGTDPYSDYRVPTVANKILSLCQQNQNAFLCRPILVRMVKERILDRLNVQTKKKYEAHLNSVATEVEKLSPAPQVPADYLNMQKVFSLSTPEDSAIKIAKEVQNLVFAIFEKTFPSLKQDPRIFQLEFEKTGPKNARVRKLQLVEFKPGWQGEATITWYKVPVSFYVEYRNGLIHDIVLLSKVKLGAGGQTSVRSCFGFLTGKFLARKKFSRDETVVGEPLFRYLFKRNQELSQQNQQIRGLTAIEAMRSVPEDSSRLQLFESMSGGTLSAILSGSLEVAFSVKKRFMKDLLCGLDGLHRIVHPGLSYNEGGLIPVRKSTGPFPIAHCDLKPSNILIRGTVQTPSAAITDFGMISPLVSAKSIGFRAPEKIRAQLAYQYYSEAITFYKAFGQPGDIWALGLIFSMILNPKKSELLYGVQYPPLDCLQNKIVGARLSKGATPASMEDWFELEESLISLTQDEIGKSVVVLQEAAVKAQVSEADKREMAQLWMLVGLMLQVDPKKRLTAEQALKKLEESPSDSKVDK